MSHQVQNHEPPASSPDIPDHLDKLLIAQVVHQAHAHGHVGTRQSLPHGVQLQYGELPHATLRRTQIHTQYLRPYFPPHFLQQPAVPHPISRTRRTACPSRLNARRIAAWLPSRLCVRESARFARSSISGSCPPPSRISFSLARHELKSAARRFAIEQDPVAGIHPIRLAVGN